MYRRLAFAVRRCDLLRRLRLFMPLTQALPPPVKEPLASSRAHRQFMEGGPTLRVVEHRSDDRASNTALTVGLAAGAASLLTAVSTRSGPVAANDDLSHELSAEEQRNVSVFAKCSPSVVHINTFVSQVRGRVGLRLDMQEIQQGAGSGFLWDGSHVVTNFHVIKDADRATVVLADHTSLEAKLVGVEPDCDLAVLKVEKPKDAQGLQLQPLERASSKLHVGQKVFAIGNPFGLDQTLTSGIVSGLGREMRGITGRLLRGLVQTDAAINPGNSGGPLLDLRGRLIGVNTMIASPSGAFAGVGFAIPVETVVRVVTQILKYGHARHPYLGLFLSPDHVTMRLSEQMQRQGAPGLDGVLVMSVEPGSPADRAGIKPTLQTRFGIKLGDEILAIDGKKVASGEELLIAVEEKNIGDKVEITYRRHQSRQEPIEQKTWVQLVERPERLIRPTSLGMRGDGGHGGGDFADGYAVADHDRPNSRL